MEEQQEQEQEQEQELEMDIKKKDQKQGRRPKKETVTFPSSQTPRVALEHSDLLDPNPDIVGLFCYYNRIYFDDQLHACTVSWSTSRMTLCAGICKYSDGSCSIRLSEPLLKFRSSKELKETLLHEMIHAYLWLTNNNKDHDDHGPCFQETMQAINSSKVDDFQRPPEGYQISIYHNFVEEVNNYRRHQWMCSCCGDLIKRAMNRTPSESDCYKKVGQRSGCDLTRCHWHIHQWQCGGEYKKIAEPEGYQDKRRKIPTSENSADNKSSLQAAKKKKSIVGSMGGEKNACKGEDATDLVCRDGSLERFFSRNKEVNKKERMTVKVQEASDNNLCSLSEEEIIVNRGKRKECKVDDSGDDPLSIGMEESKSVTWKNQHNEMLVNSENDTKHIECTVFIGWKSWYAFEGEEEEKNMEVLVNKRSERRRLEKRCSQGQYNEDNAELLSQTLPIHEEKNTRNNLRLTSMENNVVVFEDLSIVLPEETIAFGSQNNHHRTECDNEVGIIEVKTSHEGKRQKTTKSEIYTEDVSGRELQVGNHVSAGESDHETRSGKRLEDTVKHIKKPRSARKNRHIIDNEGSAAFCPICQIVLSGNIEDREFNVRLNQHIDACMENIGK